MSEDPEGERDDYARLPPGERMSLVWKLKLEELGIEPGSSDEPRLRRVIGRVIRFE